MTSISKKIRSGFSAEQFVVAVLLVSGLLLRLRQYLAGRSLWLDEAMLALNIVNRGFSGLFQPLDYDQGAPIGFLLIEKVANMLFGDHELVLRLFPFVAGVTALVLFYLLLKRTTSGIGLLLGLALFAVSPELIYYSSEVKQYIVDVSATIGLLLLAFPLFWENKEKKNYVVLGIAGALSLWFSYPALFVLAGIGTGLFVHSLQKRERSQVGSTLAIGAAWLASLALLYFSSLRGLSQNSYLLEYWQENFMPIPPWSDWGWFPLLIKGVIKNQVGVSASMSLVFSLLFLGIIAFFKKNITYTNVILLTFVFALITSGLRLYPIGGRLSLFLIPFLILLISQSIDWLQKTFHAPHKLAEIVLLLVSAYLIYAPAVGAFDRFLEPKYREHIRPTMAVLAENWEDGDVLFVSNGAAPAFRFYAERYGLGYVIFQTSTVADYKNPSNILSQIAALKGNPRAWILMTHVYEHKDFNEKDYVLAYLNSIGNMKREFRNPGTGVYLFLWDLSQ